MTDNPQSITILLHHLKRGDDDASAQIWQRYIERLLPIAAEKLKGLRSAVVDEEDILLSVFNRFFEAVKEDRFACMQGRNDLWQVLLMLTERRVADQYRVSHAQKRGGGNVRSVEDAAAVGLDIAEFVDNGPTPEFAATFADQMSVVFRRLESKAARDVAVLRMEGYGTREIADRLDISLSSVERKLRMIRTVWGEVSDE